LLGVDLVGRIDEAAVLDVNVHFLILKNAHRKGAKAMQRAAKACA